MYNREAVFKAYEELGSIQAACDHTGCPPYIAYIWLKKARMLKQNEAQKYGTNGNRSGALAEREFQRLVPKAMNLNGNLQKNCPSFDFDIYGITVDVKFSSVTSSGCWLFATAHGKAMEPDFFAVFCVPIKDGKLKDGYKLFLIPSFFTGSRKKLWIPLSNNGNPVYEFEVNPKDLSDIFEQMKDGDKIPTAPEKEVIQRPSQVAAAESMREVIPVIKVETPAVQQCNGCVHLRQDGNRIERCTNIASANYAKVTLAACKHYRKAAKNNDTQNTKN